MNAKKIAILIVAVLYFVSPVDLLPGVIVDDIIVLIPSIMYTILGKK